MEKEFLFIVPARSGSKRLAGKNLKNFNGKPLIYWTLDLSSRLKSYGSTIVTSDSDIILSKCSKYKDILLVKRPKYLSTAKASLINVIRHLLKKLNYRNNIILLQPTSPLREKEDIIKAITLINKGAKAVMSQNKLQYNLTKINLNKPNKEFIALGKKSEDVYVPNGAIFGAKYDWIKRYNTFYDKSVVTFEMPASRSIDIDFQYQFTMAEALKKKLQK